MYQKYIIYLAYYLLILSWRKVMEIDNSYYKKIVYKKNAFEDIKTFVKLNFSNKKVLLISSKSVPAENVTQLLNSLFCGSENVSHFVARQNFSNVELDMLKDRMCVGDYNLLVAFGGGKLCDVVKYFAYNFGLPYIVCPTTATSLAYFSNYCINPYDSSKSFYANMPNKIFIQEQIIKKSNCLLNISGLCFLHSLRQVYVEGIIGDNEKERYIFVGLEKAFNKLDNEQTNILLCGEDSNLVLMDLMIDFGFYIGLLNRENYYLFNMFCVYEKICAKQVCNELSGRKMLLCAKTILSILKRYIEINSVKCFEKNNYNYVSKLLKKYEINYKKLKNNAYFNEFSIKTMQKREFLDNKENYYNLINLQLKKIKEFSQKVRAVYKKGIELTDDEKCIYNSLAITPYIYNGNMIIDMVAHSGVLNAFLS